MQTNETPEDDTFGDSNDGVEDNEGVQPEERVNLIAVLTAKEIMSSDAPKCSYEQCDRKACSKWDVPNEVEPWFSCLDCQVR